MKKNDITYEYRVFTHRPIDVESMEVGRCTSKVLKELKEKDKVDGRFFHTTDSDEWFFCWNGNLQKLNLKGDADVNAALEEVNRLIAEANAAVDEAKKTAGEAKVAADAAKEAADNATAAVESIDKLEEAVASKADKSEVDALSAKVDAIKVPSLDGYATEEFVGDKIAEIEIPTVPTKVSAFENDANYLTEHQDITGKQDVIDDLETIRSGAALGATALQSIPETYITEDKLSNKKFATEEFVGDKIAEIVIPTVPTNVSEFTNDAGYLNKSEADKLYAPIGSASDGSGNYATQDFVRDEISKIEIPTVPTKVSAFENDANYLTEHQSLDNYYTKKEIDDKIDAINALISEATNITNTILA